MDQLEEYIRANRQELDRIEPVDADALWERMQQPNAKVRVLKPKSNSGWDIHIGRNWRLAIAATIALTLGIAGWLYVQSDVEDHRSMAAYSIEDYYPHIADEERDFRRTIAQRESELGLNQLERQDYIDIFNELDELENIHRQQLADLPEVFDNEEWVRTLMQYYEQKLRILEQLSREIDKRRRLEAREEARSI
ncbi:MAG: hypothetical protein R2824_30495 [Saprospiraceae bacterium]